MLVSSLIENVRIGIHDTEESVYPAAEASAAYNRAVEETQAMLIMIGARVALSSTTITGDGTNYRFDLPVPALAVAPGTLRGRSPATATTNYTKGQEVELVDDTDALFTEVPTAVGVPLRARVDTSGDRLALVFPCILTSGIIYDLKYYAKIEPITLGQEASNSTPWGGRLDRVLARAIEVILRAGAEFTGEPREKWLAEAKSAAGQLLGMNVHQRHAVYGSMFKNGAWSR